jgi:hypothetical protein
MNRSKSQSFRESLEDAGDLMALREARERDDPSVPSLSLEKVKARLGLTKNGRRPKLIRRKRR